MSEIFRHVGQFSTSRPATSGWEPGDRLPVRPYKRLKNEFVGVLTGKG
jgi:hypothetical protein